MLAENFDDVLESVLMSVEEALSTDGSADKLKRIEKEIYNLETRRKKLTDMILDDKITKEAYDEKYEDLCRKLAKAESEKQMFSDSVITQNAIIKRMFRVVAMPFLDMCAARSSRINLTLILLAIIWPPLSYIWSNYSYI